jgi:probable rRNA maturation factor
LSSSLVIRNRQRTVRVNTRLLRLAAETVLKELLKPAAFDVSVYILRASEMARLNENFLQHQGSTDVITFDYGDSSLKSESSARCLHGEIFVCIDDAIVQARQFRTSWPSEIVRYIIHGLLHLRGFDDQKPIARRKMKREENRLLKETARLFPLSKLAGDSKLRP